MSINIAVVNQSTSLTSSALSTALPNLQSQLTNDFLPVWGIPATLSIPSGSPASTDWQLVILEDFAQANVLGYHEMTLSGMPIAYVFMDNCIANNIPWTVAASHELLEMVADPAINLSVVTDASPYQQPSEIWVYAYEIADPVQDVSLAYSINGTMVSDFVYPTWFQSFWSPFGTQFSRGNTVMFPFQLQTGGSALINVIDKSMGGWQVLFGSSVMSNVMSDVNRNGFKRRRHRRTLNNKQWRRSLR